MSSRIIVLVHDTDDVIRLLEYIRENEDEYKYIRHWRRSMSFKLADRHKAQEGRVVECKNERAEFKLRLMFETGDYVI